MQDKESMHPLLKPEVAFDQKNEVTRKRCGLIHLEIQSHHTPDLQNLWRKEGREGGRDLSSQSIVGTNGWGEMWRWVQKLIIRRTVIIPKNLTLNLWEVRVKAKDQK